MNAITNLRNAYYDHIASLNVPENVKDEMIRIAHDQLQLLSKTIATMELQYLRQVQHPSPLPKRQQGGKMTKEQILNKWLNKGNVIDKGRIYFW